MYVGCQDPLSSCCSQAVGTRNLAFMQLTLLSAGCLLGQDSACPLVWCYFLRNRERHFHRGKSKFSDFPRLLRGWKSELENLRSSKGDQVCPPLHCHLPSKSLFASHLTPGSQGLDSGQFPFFSRLLSCTWNLLQQQCECLL